MICRVLTNLGPELVASSEVGSSSEDFLLFSMDFLLFSMDFLVISRDFHGFVANWVLTAAG